MTIDSYLADGANFVGLAPNTPVKGAVTKQLNGILKLHRGPLMFNELKWRSRTQLKRHGWQKAKTNEKNLDVIDEKGRHDRVGRLLPRNPHGTKEAETTIGSRKLTAMYW